MATFLEVAQTVDKILGTQGDVVSLVSPDYHVLLAEHIRNSWISIQDLRTEWKFLRDNITFNTQINKDNYTISDIFSTTEDNVRSWKLDAILYDKTQLQYTSYDKYILEDWTENPSKPAKFSLNEQDNSIYINRPDDIYAITAHYYKKPQILTENTDVVNIPNEHLYALIFAACASIGMYLGIPEIFQSYSQKSEIAIGAMMRSQNPAKRARVRGIV